jgi:hypothetical protein
MNLKDCTHQQVFICMFHFKTLFHTIMNKEQTSFTIAHTQLKPTPTYPVLQLPLADTRAEPL